MGHIFDAIYQNSILTESFTLQYINDAGDIVARDYFDSFDDAKGLFDSLVDTYERENETEKGLCINDAWGDDLICAEPVKPGKYRIIDYRAKIDESKTTPGANISAKVGDTFTVKDQLGLAKWKIIDINDNNEALYIPANDVAEQICSEVGEPLTYWPIADLLKNAEEKNGADQNESLPNKNESLDAQQACNDWINAQNRPFNNPEFYDDAVRIDSVLSSWGYDTDEILNTSNYCMDHHIDVESLTDSEIESLCLLINQGQIEYDTLRNSEDDIEAWKQDEARVRKIMADAEELTKRG